MIFPVIIAGGSGTRFWPLSRSARPKQFLPLATSRPLIAETQRRLGKLARADNLYVVCGKAHARGVRKWVKGLPARNLLVEPAARNTAPAIGLAALHVARRAPDGILAVLPADHHVANPEAFRKALDAGAALAQSGMLVTLGIRPSRPETGFGYIRRGRSLGDFGSAVKAFVEKPDRATAERYVRSGDYFWNAGIFLFRADALIEAMSTHLPEVWRGLSKIQDALGTKRYREVLERTFPRLPSISIDYGVMERAKNLAMVPGDFGWSDLGSFTALGEVHPEDASGNVVLGDGPLLIDARRCVVVGAGRPLAILGMEDAVVVDSGDALLVMPASRAQDVRAVVDELKKRKMQRFL